MEPCRTSGLTEVQAPADQSDLANVQEVLPLPRLHVDVLPLLAHDVHARDERANDQADRAAPPDDGRADEVVLELLVAPAAHAQADAEERPVGRLGREDVLLVRVGHERVVRGGHRDVEVPEVAQERRAVELHVARGQAVVPVRLDVPVRVDVARVVLLLAAHLDLLEAPLRQDRVRRAQVAARCLVAESQAGRQRVDPLVLVLGAAVDVVDDLDNPVILVVADSRVAVARHLIVKLRHRRRDGVRVQVTGSGGVLQTNRITILEEMEGKFRVVLGLVPSREEDPLVVLVLIVVASDLLLFRTDWVRLHVRMQKTSTPAHVFQSDLGTVCNIWRTCQLSLLRIKITSHTKGILIERVSDKVCLEQ